MLTVTVSIPTYNRCGYLKEAIDSVLAQTYSEFKLLITDNCSQDGTKELVESYIARDPRVVYHRFSSNQGSAPNWKYALATPDTDLVALLLDDDLWLPKHLEYAVRAMEEIADASMYGCATEAFGNLPTQAVKVQHPFWLAHCRERSTYDARKNFVPMLMGPPMAASSIVLRRRSLDGISIFMDNDFLSGDFYLWAQMALQGVMVYEPTVNARYRWHIGNDSLRQMGRRVRAAQYFYVRRQLSILAMKEKALTPQMLVNEAADWPITHLSVLVVSLSSFDTPPSLRWAARQLFEKRRDDGNNPLASRHFRIACKIGKWYLSIADLMERTVSWWWHPKGKIFISENKLN